MSDVLGGIGRGQKFAEAASSAGGRALREIAGAPPTQSPSGEALQNMHISNQLPMHIPFHAVNQMQPRARPPSFEEEILEQETQPRTERRRRLRQVSVEPLDDEEEPSQFEAMQPRVRMVERAPPSGPRGALSAPGGFVTRRPSRVQRLRVPDLEEEIIEEEEEFPRPLRKRPHRRVRETTEVVRQFVEPRPRSRASRASEDSLRRIPSRPQAFPEDRPSPTRRRYARVIR